MEELNSKVTATRQRATAMYFIDRLALRAGNEKGEDEADTVGCCSLRVEHVGLIPPNRLRFDFLGKDSIRYVNEVEVNEQVFKNVKIFKREPKADGDMLFDRLDVRLLPSRMQDSGLEISADTLVLLSCLFLPDQHRQQASLDPHDWPLRQGLPNVQRLAHNGAGAREHARRRNRRRKDPRLQPSQQEGRRPL
jgi:hypothetical protein